MFWEEVEALEDHADLPRPRLPSLERDLAGLRLLEPREASARASTCPSLRAR